MTDFRKKQMRKECVERVQLSLGKKITPTEASDLLAQVRARMAALRLKDPVAWDAMSKQARLERKQHWLRSQRQMAESRPSAR